MFSFSQWCVSPVPASRGKPTPILGICTQLAKNRRRRWTKPRSGGLAGWCGCCQSHLAWSRLSHDNEDAGRTVRSLQEPVDVRPNGGHTDPIGEFLAPIRIWPATEIAKADVAAVIPEHRIMTAPMGRVFPLDQANLAANPTPFGLGGLRP